MQKEWLPLKKGDWIQIIAPASTIPDSEITLAKIKTFLESWGLKVKISALVLGENKSFPNLANTDENRFEDLKSALLDDEIKAIWCARGGYGSIRLMRQLMNLTAPATPKLFIGFSDITLLLLHLSQQWQWNVIHAPSANQAAHQMVAAEDIEILRQLMFGILNTTQIDDLVALNDVAKSNATIKSNLIGGNLTLMGRTLGWDKTGPQTIHNKILVLEDHSEPFRKIDGVLQQMELANYFSDETKPAAVILGDFSTANESEQKQVNNALQEFAVRLDKMGVPVLSCTGIGHQQGNHPLPMGPTATLSLGKNPSLTVKSGAKL